jgi:hypothetical protein
MQPTVWTTQRKALGNFIPALFWLLPTAVGLGWMVIHSEIIGPGLNWVVGGTVIGWLALNQFGGITNGRLRRQLERILVARGDAKDVAGTFVGFATPRYSSLLDAHEDLGFLIPLPDRLRFVSETRTVEVLKSEVTKVRFRANVHTWVALGRWISIEGRSGGRPIRLLIEPRNRISMLGNLRSGGKLKRELQAWLASSSTN